MLANRLKKRLAHLRKWAKRTGAGAFRLYDRDIPEIPLVLDLYGDVVSGALYKRPYEKDEAEEELWLDAMRGAAALAAGTAPGNVIIRRRLRQRGKAQYEKLASRGLIRIINEGELKFKVNLSDYLDTGLFLDRRVMRRMIHDDSKGRRVLNLFCYTGSFSVHAAGGGAASTVSVDLSNTYLNWAEENFTLNNFNAKIMRPEEFFSRNPAGPAEGCRNFLVRADITAFLRGAAQARRRWDSIVLDPPAFSNSAMAASDFDLQRDCKALLSGCLALLAPGGRLWFSASSRSFKTGAAELETALAWDFPGVKAADISGKLTDEDFRGKKAPAAILFQRPAASG